eukprot:2498485-Prorocentrum_lima.AAC.1
MNNKKCETFWIKRQLVVAQRPVMQYGPDSQTEFPTDLAEEKGNHHSKVTQLHRCECARGYDQHLHIAKG